MTEVTFEQARVDKSLRQPYCDQFLAEHPHLFVERVVYDPAQAHFRGWVDGLLAKGLLSKRAHAEAMYGVLSVVPEMFVPWAHIEQMGKGEKVPVFVSHLPFDCYTVDGFENTLRNHEYVHAVDFCQGIVVGNERLDHANYGQVFPTIAISFVEMRACASELQGAAERGFPSLTRDPRHYSYNRLLQRMHIYAGHLSEESSGINMRRGKICTPLEGKIAAAGLDLFWNTKELRKQASSKWSEVPE